MVTSWSENSPTEEAKSGRAGRQSQVVAIEVGTTDNPEAHDQPLQEQSRWVHLVNKLRVRSSRAF
jgi:hypothetical protein